MKEICCKQFQKLLDQNIFQPCYDIFIMKGKEKLVDDGDGYKDDMTPEYEMIYCPFCGKQIVSENEKVKYNKRRK